MESIQARGFKSNHVKQTTQYLQIKHKLLTSENVFLRAKKISAHTEARHRYEEKMDADILRLSIATEKRIRKYREPVWSQQLHQERIIVNILSKTLAMARTGIDISKQIEADMNKLDNPIPVPSSIPECSVALRDAKRRVKATVKESHSTRSAERDQAIQAMEHSKDPCHKRKVTILKQIRKAESVQALFRKLKYLRTPSRTYGITRIEIPTDPLIDPSMSTNWKEIDVPSEILHHLQARNQKHFSQSHGTPFTVPPLSEDLGFQGYTKEG